MRFEIITFVAIRLCQLGGDYLYAALYFASACIVHPLEACSLLVAPPRARDPAINFRSTATQSCFQLPEISKVLKKKFFFSSHTKACFWHRRKVSVFAVRCLTACDNSNYFASVITDCYPAAIVSNEMNPASIGTGMNQPLWVINWSCCSLDHWAGAWRGGEVAMCG